MGTRMRYEWFIAKRYLKPQGGATFIFHLTLISMAGVALGVASLITVLSVMNGFGNYLRSIMVEVGSHVVMNYDSAGGLKNAEEFMDELVKIPNVEACSPVIQYWGMIQRTNYPGSSPQLVTFMGVDPDLESRVTGLSDNMIAGSLEGLKQEVRPSASQKKVRLNELVAQSDGVKQFPGIIIGKEMAYLYFGAQETDEISQEEAYQYVLGQKLTLLTYLSEGESVTEGKPVQRTFVVEGVFETGHYQYDSSLVYISLLSAQVLLQIPEGRINSIQFRLYDHSKEATNKTFDAIVAKNQEILGWYGGGTTWMNQHQVFFQALDIEKRTMDYILKIIILVATFNIIATLFMVVTEKTRDIGLLRAIGAGRRNVMSIFVLLGIIVGALGAVFGVAGGYTICSIIQIFPPELPGDGQVYYLKYLPCDMEAMDFIWVSVYTLVVSFLASIYPAVRASRFIPVEALRFS
ncbi:MAG: FtsX-like permease family protein [Candidatus Hinthialibacter sp.]